MICTASFDKDVPPWLKHGDSGWLTAEYGMLPGSTSTRNKERLQRVNNLEEQLRFKG